MSKRIGNHLVFVVSKETKKQKQNNQRIEEKGNRYLGAAACLM